MSIKHILVALSGEAAASHVPLCALNLARRLSAHVTATDTVGDATIYFDSTGVGLAPADYQQIQSAMDKAQAHNRARARKAFDDAVAVAKVPIVDRPSCDGTSALWVDGSTLGGSAVTALGRLADLVVIDRPGEKGGIADLDSMETAVFTVHRPVLVVPHGVSEIGETAAIAWNGSAEAANAVERALDLLAPSTKVAIIQVGELRPAAASPEELITYLGWHGFKSVEYHHIADEPKATGKLVLKTAKAVGAGLLIMGAYTHSRFREMLLGGVTDHILKKTHIPVLLAH